MSDKTAGFSTLHTDEPDCHALHGEMLLCGTHHVVRMPESTCDLREMRLLVHGLVS